MALTIYWTKRASKHFDFIIEYLELEWGDKVTRRFIKSLFKNITKKEFRSQNSESRMFFLGNGYIFNI